MPSFTFLLLLISLQIKFLKGNVRFVCPAPTSPRSDLEMNSCDEQVSLANTDVTLLHPGLFTVTFEETKFQSSAPFRILLLDNSRSTQNESNTNSTQHIFDEARQSCLLLDHIPHNNHAIISSECSKKSNTYPLGVCNGSIYHITIRVPDVACDDCSLMLQQVITPELGDCELNAQREANNSTNCSVYTSCARVRISPSVGGTEKDLDYCSDYLGNLPGDWPFTPEDVYQTEHGSILAFGLFHKRLTIQIPSSLNLGPIERVEIHHNLTKIWNVSVTAKNMMDNDGQVKISWEELTEAELESLKNGELVLNIVGSQKSLAEDIVFLAQHFAEGKFSALHDLYSESGWLLSHKFLGAQADDPAVVTPWGPCAPEANYYMAFLQSVHVTAHGILGMTVLENMAYITAVLHVDKEIVLSIKIRGPDLVAISLIDVTVPPSFNGILHSAYDITEQLPYINTVKFLKTVEVETDKENAVLVGDLEEGLYTILRDNTGSIRGMAAIQFTQGQWLRVEVVLNNLSSTIQSAWLMGPGSTKLVDLSRETIHCTQEFCCLEAMIHEVTSELVLHLMKGQVFLHATAGGVTVTGEVRGSALRYCQMWDGKCDPSFLQFSLSGIGIEQHKGGQEQTGSVGWTDTQAYVLDRSNVLHYCLQVENVDMNGKYFTTGLVTDGGKRIDSVPFELLAEQNKTHIACNQIPLDNTRPFIAILAQKSHKWLSLVISEGPHQLSSWDVPSVVKGQCFFRKIHEVGKDRGYWSPSSAPLQDMYAVISDQLRFIFGKNTTLYKMSSKAAMINCDFTSSLTLLPASVGEGMDLHDYELKQAGSLYFADQNTCHSTSPLKLIVHVIEGKNQLLNNKDEELCYKSVYSGWRDKELKKWKEPEVSGPVLIGLVIGLSVGGIFILWQGIQLKRVPNSGRDNVFLRF